MTGNRKSPGVLCRAVIDRHAIRRHHAQRPPGPVEANLREMGEDTYRASSQSRNNLQRGRLVEADIFVRIPDLQGPFRCLSHLQRCRGQERGHAIGNQQLTSQWLDRYVHVEVLT